VLWFKFKILNRFLIRVFFLLFILYVWWRDISRESIYQGFHNIFVQTGLKLGIILFILSEVLFFLGFFWTFFHRRLVPIREIGLRWPPFNIYPLNPFQIPLLNTCILLSSGIRVTWRHYSLVNNYKSTFLRLLVTIILGIYFTFLQWFEYNDATFCINDSIYGSTFYIATGFHGFHVLIGSLFLLVSLLRLSAGHFSQYHHLGFEIAIWYWHFVDVVWLFLFSIMYWWSFWFISEIII
jgi:cytochrome c oxidase subunit 3